MIAVYIAYFGLLLITLILYGSLLRTNYWYSISIVLLMILWLLTSVTAIYLSVVAKLNNNLFVFHISTPLEYLLLAMLYEQAIINRHLKKLIGLSIPVFIGLSILFAAFVQKPDANNSYITILESILLISISLFYLREILILQHVPILHQFPMFWITVGILLYYSGNLLIEGLLNYMINHSMELARRTYKLGHVFKYLTFILFIIGAVSGKNIVRIKKISEVKNELY